MVEIVENLDQAIEWIHWYGSGHTELIVCSDESPVGEEFFKRVDAAFVFKNASTRFMDGFRYLGLGLNLVYLPAYLLSSTKGSERSAYHQVATALIRLRLCAGFQRGICLQVIHQQGVDMT